MAPFQLGTFEIEPQRNIIRHDGTEIRLDPKIIGVLCALAGAAGSVVSRSELIDAVWGVEHGGDESLTRAISLLRATFKQCDSSTRLIETVPRRGYRLTEAVESIIAAPIEETGREEEFSGPPIDPVKTSRADPVGLPFVLSGLVLGLVVLGLIVTSLGNQRAPAAPAQQTASVAVLPFDDLSPTGDKDYFAIGVSDEIRTTLNRFEDIQVIGRSSSFASAANNATAIETGSLLGAAFILDGSVRWAGDQAFVTSELVDASDGTVVWSNSYDRDMTPGDIVAIQSDIAGEVAGALSVAFGLTLDVTMRTRTEGVGTSSLVAYDLYLQARMGRDRMSSRDAITLLRRAVDEDPNYGAAWSLMGIRTGGLQWGARSAAEARGYFEEALYLTRRGVELDPDSAEARSYYGGMLVGTKDFGASEEQHRMALSLGANSASLVQYTRLLQRTGRISVALAPAARAQELEPLTRFVDLDAELMRQIGNYDAAYSSLDKANEGDFSDYAQSFERWLIEANANPKSEQSWAYLKEFREQATNEAASIIDIVLRNRETPEIARRELRAEFAKTEEHYPEKLIHIAVFAALQDDPHLALEAMTEEINWSTVRMTYLWDELFSRMRQLPEFKQFVRLNGLETYWREYGWADVCRPLSDADFECI